MLGRLRVAYWSAVLERRVKARSGKVLELAVTKLK